MRYQADDLRALIKTTLTPLGYWSPAAEELLMATCAQESSMGFYRQQVGGPALGIFQMEPGDHDDIWKNYLQYHSDLALRIGMLAGAAAPVALALVNNDPYAIAMARVHYLRAPGVLPAADDLAGLWSYYKRFWNTELGAATQAQFEGNYARYVHGSAT